MRVPRKVTNDNGDRNITGWIARRTTSAALLATAVMVLTGATCKRKMRQIPQYRRELWTAEADENLDRIYQGLARLWKRSKDKATFQFPSAGPSPAQVPCGARPHKPDPAVWQGNGWKTIGFSIAKPFRYRYQVIASGKGPKAAFTIRVNGDLDCDGTYSTFELMGSIDSHGRLTDLGGKKFDEAKATE